MRNHERRMTQAEADYYRLIRKWKDKAEEAQKQEPYDLLTPEEETWMNLTLCSSPTDGFTETNVFHRFFKQPSNVGIASGPAKATELTKERHIQRIKMLMEEVWELVDACGLEITDELSGSVIKDGRFQYAVTHKPNQIEIGDALADIKVLANGHAIEAGINLPLWEREVFFSNMTKADENGEPIVNEHGKIQKGPNYVKPDFETMLQIAEEGY